MIDPKPAETSSKPLDVETVRTVDSRELFAGHDEIWIEHEGERYRLRITRRGRLILQK